MLITKALNVFFVYGALINNPAKKSHLFLKKITFFTLMKKRFLLIQ